MSAQLGTGERVAEMLVRPRKPVCTGFAAAAWLDQLLEGVTEGFESLRLRFECPREVVAIATYSAGHQRLHLHPDLVREPHDWQVFNVPEAPAHLPLPQPHARGYEQC